MENQYEPPFHQTNTMTNLVIEIADYAGQIGSHENLSKHPELRRENRIRTIYSSLAIEQNTLSLQQADSSGESTVFVEFMLTMIRDILSEIVTGQNKNTAINTRYRNTAPQSTEYRILHLLKDDPEMSSNDIAELIGLSQRQILRIMSKLRDEGKLMHEGSRKKGRWIVK